MAGKNIKPAKTKAPAIKPKKPKTQVKDVATPKQYNGYPDGKQALGVFKGLKSAPSKGNKFK